MENNNKPRDVEIGKEIGFLTPIKILPKSKKGIEVDCLCRCGAHVKRHISNLRRALNNSQSPACKKCNRKVIKSNEFRWISNQTSTSYRR